MPSRGERTGVAGPRPQPDCAYLHTERRKRGVTLALLHLEYRVRPEGEGASRVDVRSKSRDGKGDLGANAARIRAYVAALEAAARKM